MAQKGMAYGIGDNKFAPDASVTRAQFTALLVRLLKLQEDSTSIPFKDVPSNAWYAKAIGAAVKAGLIAGYSEDVFAPDDEITREQMVAMLIRALKRANTKPVQVQNSDAILARFKDKNEISEWAKVVVAQVVNEGIMTGRGIDIFTSRGTTTRAKATVVINRIS